jgi:hypothetical protein
VTKPADRDTACAPEDEQHAFITKRNSYGVADAAVTSPWPNMLTQGRPG